MRLHRAWIDLALVLAVLAGAGLLFVGASSLPAPRFEPMGSAALPRILGGLLIFFVLLIAIKAVAQLRQMARSTSVDRENAEQLAEVDKAGLLRAGTVFSALVCYVLALDVMQWPFIVVTPVFVAIVGSALSTRRLRSFGLFGVFGIVLALAIYAVMTRFLYVDLG